MVVTQKQDYLEVMVIGQEKRGKSLWNSELEAVNKITGCQQFIYKGTIYFKNVDIIED